MLTLGGDGTMLGAMRIVAGHLVAGRTVPAPGVSRGHPDFLAAVDPADLEAAPTRLVSGEFTPGPHPDLVTAVDGGPELVAFDDVVLIRPAPRDR